MILKISLNPESINLYNRPTHDSMFIYHPDLIIIMEESLIVDIYRYRPAHANSTVDEWFKICCSEKSGLIFAIGKICRTKRVVSEFIFA